MKAAIKPPSAPGRGRPRKVREYQTQITTSIPVSLAERLDEHCERTGETKMGVFAEALTQYLDRQEGKE